MKNILPFALLLFSLSLFAQDTTMDRGSLITGMMEGFFVKTPQDTTIYLGGKSGDRFVFDDRNCFNTVAASMVLLEGNPALMCDRTHYSGNKLVSRKKSSAAGYAYTRWDNAAYQEILLSEYNISMVFTSSKGKPGWFRSSSPVAVSADYHAGGQVSVIRALSIEDSVEIKKRITTGLSSFVSQELLKEWLKGAPFYRISYEALFRQDGLLLSAGHYYGDGFVDTRQKVGNWTEWDEKEKRYVEKVYRLP